MNEFMGRVTYPSRLAASCLRSSVLRLTQAPMSFTGISWYSAVNLESGSSSLGTGVLVLALGVAGAFFALRFVTREVVLDAAGERVSERYRGDDCLVMVGDS